jgi:predicted aspartyl protease
MAGNFDRPSADNPDMGQVTVRIHLTHPLDSYLAAAGRMPPDEVRVAEVDGVVDTAATLMVLPGEVCTRLGLQSHGTRNVRYANGATAKIAWTSVRLRILGREMLCDALIEEARTTALIGQIPLEELDFVVDPKARELRVNPESPDAPLLEVCAAG